MRLIPQPTDNLSIGLPLVHTLRDENGVVLLNRGSVIEDDVQLKALKLRGTVYVDLNEAQQVQRQLAAELDDMSRRDTPLSAFASFVPQDEQPAAPPQEVEKGNLAVRWGEMESRLITLLGSVGTATHFEVRTAQLESEVRALMAEDRDVALYLLFYQSGAMYANYSASHSLLCMVVCELLADLLQLPDVERAALNRAALTMNIAMTALQDQLALQRHPPSPQQQETILAHSARGRLLLARAGVADTLWLDIVACHHENLSSAKALAEQPPVERLTRLLQTVDRYTAAMSPRKSRAGRTARDSARSVIVQAEPGRHDEAGTALVRVLGLSPPGTFVRLATGEVAVVLRRGPKPNQPLVGVVLNKRDEPIAEAKLVNTARDGMAVQAAVPASNVRVRLNQEAMLRLLDKARTDASDSLLRALDPAPAGNAYNPSAFQKLM